MTKTTWRGCQAVNNALVTSATLNCHQEYIDVAANWNDPIDRVAGFKDYSASYSLLMFNEPLDSFSMLDFLQEHTNESVQHRFLGAGNRCQYCGTVWLPGTFKCPSCGGDIRIESHAMEWEHGDGIITGFNYKVQRDMPIRLDIEVYYSRFEWFNFNKPDMVEALRYSLFGKPGDWLCSYCGYYVHGEQSLCPGCGGQRLPINQLSDLKRQCIYCGRVTYGGFACSQCNTRLTRSYH
jgi:rubrerythrin